MSTKRTTRSRGNALPDEIIEVLGCMGGLHSYTDDWLAQQWQLWGPQLRQWWRRQFGDEPLIDDFARRGGWATKVLPDKIVKFKRDLP